MRLIGQTDVKPLPAIQINQIFLGDHGAFGKLAWTAIDGLADQQFFDTVKRVVFNDTQLIVQVLAITTQLIINDGLRTLVAHDAFTGEDLHVNDRADHTRRYAQRRVFYVRGFFTKNCTQQFFFWCQLGLAFWRDLADEHIVSANFSADVNNTRVIQTVELGFSQIADVARDFFRTKLGIACHNRQFFDVNRSVTIISHNFFRDQNRIFEVVTVPWHKCDQHVLTQSQFAQVCRCAISQYVASCNTITTAHDRALVDVRVLVRACVLDQVVDINANFTCDVFFVVHANHDAVCINVIHDTATQSLNSSARVNGYSALNARSDNWFFRTQARYCLTLHVCAHQCTVCVVMLKERDQRCCN